MEEVRVSFSRYKVQWKGICNVKIQDNSIEQLHKIEDTFQVKIGEMLVEIAYSKTNKSLNECLLNILKHKEGR